MRVTLICCVPAPVDYTEVPWKSLAWARDNTPFLISLAGVGTGIIWRLGGIAPPLIPPRTRQRAERCRATAPPSTVRWGKGAPRAPHWAEGRPWDLAKWQSPRLWELGAA